MSKYTLDELAHELNIKIANSQTFNIVNKEHRTNSTTYMNAGKLILNMDLYRHSKVDAILLVADSGVLGADGITVQLYDKTNGAEVDTIDFGGAEDDTVKIVDVKEYLLEKTGRLVLEVNFKKAGAIGPSDLSSACLEIQGIFDGG